MKRRFLLWDNPRQAIFTLMVVLLLWGAINVYSASYVSAQDMVGNGMYFLKRYLIFAGLGLVAIRFIRKAGYRFFLRPLMLWGLFALALLMLVAVMVIGIMHGHSNAINGATRWLALGPISVQPSELAKLVVIMLSARYLGLGLRQERELAPLGKRALPVVIVTIVFCLLIYKQPDLGTAAIVAGLLLGMFIIAGLPRMQLFVVLLGGLALAVLTTISSPYRLERIKVWFDPWLDERNTGYQMVQSLRAIGSGGLTGTGWGHGIGKFFYLPEAHTDFAFAILCQENGFLGVLLLLLLFTLLGAAFIRITLGARNQSAFLLAAGVTFLIIGQAAANMAMVCGILPVIGVPLIFISYGGSSMLVSMGAIGLLLSVYDEEERLARIEEASPEQRREMLQVVGGRRWRS